MADWKSQAGLIKINFDNGSLAAYYISVSHTIFKQKTIEEAITRYGVESWVWIENYGTHQVMGFSKPPINSVPRYADPAYILVFAVDVIASLIT